MSVLLQISDTHFGTEQAPVVEALATLASQQRPDVVVLSGDITQRARPAQFRAARAFVDRLGAPVLAIPGNHDIPLFDLWARLRRPYARYVAAFGADLEPVHSLARPDGGVRQHHAGLAAQAWRGVRAADRPRGPTPGRRRRRAAARGGGAPARGRDARRRRAQPAARACGRAAALGRRRRRPRHGRAHPPALRHAAARPGTAAVGVQAGTAVSSRVREGVPNSVNLLRWGADSAPGCCQIEQWDFSADDRAFVRAKVSEVRPARP